MKGSLEALLSADPAGMSHSERLDYVAAMEALKARVSARSIKGLAMIEVDPPLRADIDLSRDKQWVREEVACLLHIAPQTARQKMADAVDLCHELEATVELLESGAMSEMHARALLDHTRDVTSEVRGQVQQRVLPKAPQQTVSEFRQAVKRAVLSLDKRNQQEKHKASAKDRGMWVRPEDNGMATLTVFSTAPDVASIMTAAQGRSDRTKIMNRRKAGAGNDPDGRTSDQRRVDALVELCLTDLANNDTTTQGRKPSIQVTLAWSTVFGTDDQPAELAGYGPISADQARQLAAEASATWRWIMHDEHGQVIDISTDTYKPPAALRDFILARDGTCRLPGCRKRAHHCEIDHIQAWADGGPTSPENLHGACLRDHHLKHEAGWTVTRNPDGTTVWITPTGRRYDKPPDWIPLDSTSQHRPTPPTDDEPPPF